MEKIYIVTSGSYSDYGIDAVFKNREAAEKYIDKFGDYDARIEEYVLSDTVDNYKLEEYKVVVARLEVGGDFSISTTTFNTGETPKERARGTHLIGGRYTNEIRGVIIHRVSNDDEIDQEKYKKICSDILAEAKYMREVEGFSFVQIAEIIERK